MWHVPIVHRRSLVIQLKTDNDRLTHIYLECGHSAEPHVDPGQSPLISSLPHLLLYLLVSFTFPVFPTRFIHFLAFPSLPILPV